jgi:hypothetical protein
MARAHVRELIVAIQLQQSPHLSIVPEQNVSASPKYMGRSPDERRTEDVGRQVCQRQNVKAMLNRVVR